MIRWRGVPQIIAVTSERPDMPNLNRRGFLAASAAAVSLRAVPQIATKTGGRRILTLVYDKSLGMMRAVDRLVP